MTTNQLPLQSNRPPQREPRFGFLNAQFWSLSSDLSIQALKRAVQGTDMLLTNSEPLYHYTNFDGLMGIVESRGVWAGHVRYLNDVEEIFHGRGLARQVLAVYLRRSEYRAFRPVLETVIEMLKGDDLPNDYVACFSQDGDNLNQWRGYCPNGGVSIEFDVSTSNPFVAMPVMAMRKVTYGNISKCKVIIDIVKRFSSEFFRDLDHYHGELPTDHLEDYTKYLRNNLEHSFVGFKHPAFESEREIRLIVSHADNDDDFDRKRFRSNGRFIVPFYATNELVTFDKDRNRIQPDPLPIRRVIVGPSQFHQAAARSVRDFMRYQGYADCRVDVSSIPFRSLQ